MRTGPIMGQPQPLIPPAMPLMAPAQNIPPPLRLPAMSQPAQVMDPRYQPRPAVIQNQVNLIYD